MPEKDIHLWQLIVGTILTWSAMFMAMMGFNYRWIRNATNKDCVLKPDCKEDRQAFIEELRLIRQDNKADFQRLYDKLEEK